MGVATATIVGAALAAGASVGAAKIGSNAAKDAARTQSASAEKSAKLQTDSANRAAELQAQSAREALDFTRGQSQLSLDQYNQQQQRLQPYRNLGNFALGMGPDAAPAPLRLPSLPGQQTAPPGQPAPTQSGGSDPANYVLSLVQSGVSPQEAAAKANEKFNLQTGSQAVYYADTNTIGLPSVYLAGPTNKPDSPAAWNIVPRVGGGSGMGSNQKVTLGFKPSATPFAAAAPLTPALQAPSVQYRPLGQIGNY